MKTYTFKLPDLGEGIIESEVTTWHVSVGDLVVEDQLLADVQTDKASVEVTSPVTGRVTVLGCEAGHMLAVGDELVRFEIKGKDGKPASAPAPATPPAGPWKEPEEPPSSLHGVHGSHPNRSSGSDSVFRQVLASPSLRKRAKEAGVNLMDVPGKSPRGRISHQDFEAFMAARSKEQAPGQGVTEIKLTGLRRVIARNMQQAKRTIPHYSYIEEVDVTDLEALRAYLNANREDNQAKLTPLPFLMLALVKVLPRFPHCNAHFDGETETLTEYRQVHAGIATMTAAGLMVPVVRNSETLDIWRAAAEMERVCGLARDGKATMRDLGGSTITISSLGALGGIAATPVINAPETAIIGVNKMQERPVVRSGRIVIRTMMNLSASFDHRIVDGHDGARLIQDLKTLLETPGAIFA